MEQNDVCVTNITEKCNKRFDHIDEALSKLDTALRGNGEPGVKQRIDRLERSGAITHRALWVVYGAIITATILYVVPKLLSL